MNCAACLQKIRQNEVGISCSSKTCKQMFHAACTQAERLSSDEIKIWICPDCTAKARKGGNNSQTPVRPSSENVTVRNKNKQNAPSGRSTAVAAVTTVTTTIASPVNPAAPTITTISSGPADELQSLSSEINLLRQTASGMWDSLKARLDSISEKITNYDSRIRSLEALQAENIELKATVSNLQSQLDNQAQLNLRNELEVIGLEEEPNENPYHLALTTAVKLGVPLQDTDLAYVSRAGPKRSDECDDVGKQLQRPLVVAFTRRVKRDEFLKQAKVRRNLKSNDIVGQGPGRTVYVNERLTSANRRLFRSTRSFANTYKYKHSWTLNGAIFVRKRDASRGSPAIRIFSEEDLNRLSQSAQTDQDRDTPNEHSAEPAQPTTHDICP